MIKQITINQYTCEKCFHVWQSKPGKDISPRICPKCKSIKWNDGNGVESPKTSNSSSTKTTNKREITPIMPTDAAYQERVILLDSETTNDFAE